MGWLLWELMGAAGSGRRKVLGIDPEILGERAFIIIFLNSSGFPAYCSLT